MSANRKYYCDISFVIIGQNKVGQQSYNYYNYYLLLGK